MILSKKVSCHFVNTKGPFPLWCFNQTGIPMATVKGPPQPHEGGSDALRIEPYVVKLIKALEKHKSSVCWLLAQVHHFLAVGGEQTAAVQLLWCKLMKKPTVKGSIPGHHEDTPHSPSKPVSVLEGVLQQGFLCSLWSTQWCWEAWDGEGQLHSASHWMCAGKLMLSVEQTPSDLPEAWKEQGSGCLCDSMQSYFPLRLPACTFSHTQINEYYYEPH